MVDGASGYTTGAGGYTKKSNIVSVPVPRPRETREVRDGYGTGMGQVWDGNGTGMGRVWDGYWTGKGWDGELDNLL